MKGTLCAGHMVWPQPGGASMHGVFKAHGWLSLRGWSKAREGAKKWARGLKAGMLLDGGGLRNQSTLLVVVQTIFILAFSSRMGDPFFIFLFP